MGFVSIYNRCSRYYVCIVSRAKGFRVLKCIFPSPSCRNWGSPTRNWIDLPVPVFDPLNLKSFTANKEAPWPKVSPLVTTDSSSPGFVVLSHWIIVLDNFFKYIMAMMITERKSGSGPKFTNSVLLFFRARRTVNVLRYPHVIRPKLPKPIFPFHQTCIGPQYRMWGQLSIFLVGDVLAGPFAKRGMLIRKCLFLATCCW